MNYHTRDMKSQEFVGLPRAPSVISPADPIHCPSCNWSGHARDCKAVVNCVLCCPGCGAGVEKGK